MSAIPPDLNTIHNPAPGAIATAAWGDGIRDRFEFVLREYPRARVTRSGGYSHVSSGSYVSIPFNLESRDVGGCHSNVSNTSRLTVPAGCGGDYLIGGNIGWANNTTGRRLLHITKNGTTILARTEFHVSSDVSGVSNSSGGLVTEALLSPGDYVELRAYQNSGGSLDIIVDAEWSPVFWFQLIGS